MSNDRRNIGPVDHQSSSPSRREKDQILKREDYWVKRVRGDVSLGGRDAKCGAYRWLHQESLSEFECQGDEFQDKKNERERDSSNEDYAEC